VHFHLSTLYGWEAAVARAGSKTGTSKPAAKKGAVKLPPKPTPRRFKLCIDFSPFPDNTILGPSFSLAGFAFNQNPGGPDMFVNVTGPEKGLQFPNQGMQVKLPFKVRAVTMRVGDFGGPFDIAARDSQGNQVATRTVNFHNAYGNISMSSTSGDIATLEFTKGTNEGILVQLCITLIC
jgi:hypothetical protein